MKRTRRATAVALALTALLLTNCDSDSEGKATPGADGGQTLLRPGDEADGMRLTTATGADTKIFGTFCDPVIVKAGTYARTCQVPELQRLMIGLGNIATSAELLEQGWQAGRWQLYLDGQRVDLATFGTLPDDHYFETAVGQQVWLREWSVTIVNPSPGQHTLRYLQEPFPRGDGAAGRMDATWTFTVIRSPGSPAEDTQP